MSTWRLPEGWAARPATMSDVEVYTDAKNERWRTTVGTDWATYESVRSSWGTASRDLARDSHLILDPGGALAGAATYINMGEPHVLGFNRVFVAVAHEADAELWDLLHAWALARSRELVDLAPDDARISVATDAFPEDRQHVESIKRCGYALVRVNNQMRIEFGGPIPDPEWPPGITLRHADVGRELEALVEIQDEIFRDHWGYIEGQQAHLLESWRASFEALGDAFDPRLWMIAMDGDEIAGMVFCADRLGSDTSTAHVEMLGVRRPWRGQGLARALLLHAFGELRRIGLSTAELGVDSDNISGALRLYESVGMSSIRKRLLYELELRAGENLIRNL